MSSPRPLRVLCLNGGSSSLKLALFQLAPSFQPAHLQPARFQRVRADAREELELVLLARGAVDRVGARDADGTARPGTLRLERVGGAARSHEAPFPSLAEAAEAALTGLPALLGEIDAAEAGGGEEGAARPPRPGAAEEAAPRPAPADVVAHRIVHGGPGYEAPQRVDAELRRQLGEAAGLAPLHLPPALEVLDAARGRLPHVPHVACFDGAFHAALPEEARRLPLPRELDADGVRRVGFHGLSFASVVRQLGGALAPRTVIAHLGSGSSLVALRDGRPVDTTMGLTPAGGVVMGTRTGDLDPGVLIHLMRTRGWDADRLESLLNRESGLRGLSGTSGDVRELSARRAQDPRADLALRLFARSVRKAVGALAAVLGGLDLLVFTGGVGENAGPLREEICQGLAHLGIGPGGPGAVRVVRTDEERVMAEEAAALVRKTE